ncbi:U2 small nuclear ribonucleoprotein auxiliary factor 35 kDa subunit-related protein 2-like isoform X2 [Artemia franciscana]|uniref:U2 small nuclear ribonucleoprotein auxiliary factor 35 kDa subunit-related protein 2-like isoform X2 n=1 Tax=Artemia franciscana TaxID=6661 RepID=UPI0032DA422F
MTDRLINSTLIKNKGYLPHSVFNKLLKKYSRKARRKYAAIQRNQTHEGCEENISDFDEAAYESERQRHYEEWIERDRIVHEEWKKKEEQRILLQKQKKQEEQKIREEWADLKKKAEEDLAKKEKKKQAEIDKQDSVPYGWNIPQPIPEGLINCPFFSKVGACRFGDRCSRYHEKPVISTTVLIPNFYTNLKWDIGKDDKSDQGLEFEDSEIYHHFREFYEDVEPEFRKAGKVSQFRVSMNCEPHLRGNVYVEFSRCQGAAKAFLQFQGRFYGGKQLAVLFINTPDWNSSVCGWYFTRRCPREKTCNFLHVFRNPKDEYSLNRVRSINTKKPNSLDLRTQRWSGSLSPSPERNKDEFRQRSKRRESCRYKTQEAHSKRQTKERSPSSRKLSPGHEYRYRNSKTRIRQVSSEKESSKAGRSKWRSKERSSSRSTSRRLSPNHEYRYPNSEIRRRHTSFEKETRYTQKRKHSDYRSTSPSPKKGKGRISSDGSDSDRSGSSMSAQYNRKGTEDLKYRKKQKYIESNVAKGEGDMSANHPKRHNNSESDSDVSVNSVSSSMCGSTNLKSSQCKSVRQFPTHLERSMSRNSDVKSVVDSVDHSKRWSTSSDCSPDVVKNSEKSFKESRRFVNPTEMILGGNITERSKNKAVTTYSENRKIGVDDQSGVLEPARSPLQSSDLLILEALELLQQNK